MPLIKTCSLNALEQNIAREIRAGKPREQAVAIASSTLRDACREAGKPVPTRKAFDVIRKQVTTAVQALILDKKKFKAKDDAIEWAKANDFSADVVRETKDEWRIQQRPAKDFTEGSFNTAEIDDGISTIIGRPMKKAVAKRTMEFLESAFERARKVLNPRDFAVIFQAARASAGGQISAKRRRERQLTAGENQLINKASLSGMSKAELQEMSRTINTAFELNRKSRNDNKRVISRAASLREEFRRRELADPTGPVYVELKKRGKKSVRKFVSKEQKSIHNKVGTATRNGSLKKPKACQSCKKATISKDLSAHHDDYGDPTDVRYLCRTCHGSHHTTSKGFINGQPEGGMHAHGLDRRNSKTLDDGGHLHIWILPGSGEIIYSKEDAFHQHEIFDVPAGGAMPIDGAHSHRVHLPSGAMVETKLGGAHTHTMMVETSGFDGPHIHELVLPDGTELISMTVQQFVDTLDEPPTSHPLPFASIISNALNELRAERDANMIGASLPSSLPDLSEAVEMAAKGESIAPPTFTMEVINSDYAGSGAEQGDLIEVRPDGEMIGFAKHVVADDPKDIEEFCLQWRRIEKHTARVPFVGPESARLMFVSTAPNELELARKEALVGEDALTFRDLYLQPLGLGKQDVAVGFAMPVLPHDNLNAALCEKWTPHLVEAMKTYHKAKVVALGRVAREVLTDAGVEFHSLPHPSAVRKKGNSGEVARKLKSVAKTLDATPSPVQNKSTHQKSEPSKGNATGKLADAISEMRKTGRTTCRVIKTADEKQIVYGAILDPYDVDLQTEWVPPAEIESTAHGFLKKSRVIGFEHLERADAQLVESWVEPYPSRADYKAALENRPHRAFTRKFGDDEIHSGTWVAGVQLGARAWALHKEGKLNAFSVGGFSFKTKVTTAAMPEVEFIELIESPV